jgi:hypothetical protein
MTKRQSPAQRAARNRSWAIFTLAGMCKQLELLENGNHSPEVIRHIREGLQSLTLALSILRRTS